MDDGIFLSDISGRDKPWDLHRWQAELVQGLYEGTELQRYSDRIGECSQRLGFDWTADLGTGELSLRLQTARFCRVRHCPVCQWRKSMMWRARFYKAVPAILGQYPSYRFIFLTLTIQNCLVEELRDSISKLNHAWAKLTRRRDFPAAGWVKSVEVTRNRQEGSAWSNTVHPHLHVVLMVPGSYFKGKGYIKQSRWRELWQDCLQINYLPVVNIKAVKPKLGTDSHAQALQSTLTETLKYSVKPSDLIGANSEATKEQDRQFLLTITEQLKKIRSVSVGGVLRPFISESEPDDLIHAEGILEDEQSEDGNPELWFNWRTELARYRSVKNG